eukprot:5296860-Alexandrium_andersonii.AAC.1
MSASLVGSEMCIRDSTKPQTSKCKFPFPVFSLSHATSQTKVPAARFPVSYTHLTLPTICSV